MPAAVALTVLMAVALPVFEPWKLFVDQRVEEAVPASSEQVLAEGVAAAAPDPPTDPAAPPAEVTLLASGELISHEHTTTGSVQVLSLGDGSRVLRFEDLNTSDGPLLKVWLTDAPVLPGEDGWRVFDDGQFTDLGELKGNVGSQNYLIPAEVDLAALTSVSIWCERFRVSFGAAELVPAA